MKNSVRISFINFVVAALFVPACLLGAVLNVPDDFETIQAAVVATDPGDTVLVQPGEYVENLNFLGRRITVGSLFLTTGDEAYMDSTVIDGSGEEASVVTFTEVGRDMRFTGFTITGGVHRFGGGVGCVASSPTLSYLRIRDNESTWRGGGIFCHDGSDAVIDHVYITNNSAVSGGGIGCENSSPTISYALIANNTADSEGGGIFVLQGALVISNSTMTRNVCGRASNIYMLGESLQVSNCIMWRNLNVDIFALRETQVNIDYCDIQDGRDGISAENLNYGNNNITDDPRFVDIEAEDYHLREESPCIDAGDPDSEPDPDGTRTDIGAYYFNQNLPPEVVNPIDDMIFDGDPGRVIIADLNDVFEDPNGDELGFSFRNAPEELHMGITDASRLFFNPEEDFGLRGAEITITAEDPFGETAEESFLLTILSENNFPYLFPVLPPDSSRVLENVIFFQWMDQHPLPRTYSLHLQFLSVMNDTTIIINNGASRIYMLEDVEATLRDLGLYSQWDDVEIGEIIWWVVARDDINEEVMEERWRVFVALPNDVSEIANNLPFEFKLCSPYPNPFNSATTITYGLPVSTTVSLQLYDLSGRMLEVLDEGNKQAGVHKVILNAGDLSSGLYFVQLEASGQMFTQKVMLIR